MLSRQLAGGVVQSFLFSTTLATKIDACESQLLGIGIEHRLLSRPLARILPVHLWSTELHAAWKQALSYFGPVHRKALDKWELEETNKSALGLSPGLLNAFIGFVS